MTKWVCCYSTKSPVCPLKVGRNASVLLLSPPDVDKGVSKSMCELSYLLLHHGFSVVTDFWSRQQQCELGPIPWFHSQMMEPNNNRVVLVLTPAALERAHKWVQQGRTMEEEGDHPHSAVFTACLFHIYTDQQLQRTTKRFVLVMFDADLCRKSQLPRPLLGLPLFWLPSQNKALLKELTVGGGGNYRHAEGKKKSPRQVQDVASPVMLWWILPLPSADRQHLHVSANNNGCWCLCVQQILVTEESEFYWY